MHLDKILLTKPKQLLNFKKINKNTCILQIFVNLNYYIYILLILSGYQEGK